jgi:hypothetical protein
VAGCPATRGFGVRKYEGVVAGGVRLVISAAAAPSTLQQYVIPARGVNPMVTPLDVIVLEGVFVAVGAAGAAAVVTAGGEELDVPGTPVIAAVMEG